jgi:membrane protein implicated in regulation of membrane protease activity
LLQGYLLLVDPKALNGIPYFKLVMFSIVTLTASCLWLLWYCCSGREQQQQQQRQRQQQQQSLQTALLDNASINDV